MGSGSDLERIKGQLLRFFGEVAFFWEELLIFDPTKSPGVMI